MRKGGSKAKGGAYELSIAKKIASAFNQYGIKEDDCYRTKNSGATKSQPGDLQLSPAFAKIFPATIECKHYRNVRYKLGRKLDAQPKSFPIVEWWKQLEREERDAGNKFGLLIIRENNCADLVGFDPDKLQSVWTPYNLSFKSSYFKTKLNTIFGERRVWFVTLDDFLSWYTLMLYWYIGIRRIDEVGNFKDV